MDNTILYMMHFYNMDALALQAPMLPPGIKHPARSQFSQPRPVQKIPIGLEDYTKMIQKQAEGLLAMSNPGIVPPGHPLYNKSHSIDALQAENAMLKKENAELKRQSQPKA